MPRPATHGANAAADLPPSTQASDDLPVAVSREILEILKHKATPFSELVAGHAWEPSPVPPLAHRSVPKLPPSTLHSDTAKHHWSRALNLLSARNFRDVIREFLSFSVLVPSSVEPLWGAAYVAEQQGDLVQALALLQWRPHLLGAVPELMRAAVGLAWRLRLPDTMLRLLRAHARPPSGLQRDYLMLACRYGMYRQIASFIDEESVSDPEIEEPLSAYLVLQMLESGAEVNVAQLNSFRFGQILPILVRDGQDAPTRAYRDDAAIEGTVLDKIRYLQEGFDDHERATRERFSLGHYLGMIQEARRELDFERARFLASTALSRAESVQWRQTFQEQFRQIDAETPRTDSPRKRPPAPVRPVRSFQPVRPPAPLWQQASDAAVAGQLDRAIELYQRYLQEAVKNRVWPERADPALNALAVVYNQKRERQKAIEVMLAYRDKVQARFRFHNQLATLYFLTGEYLKAAEEFKLAVDVAPGAIERQKAHKNAINARQRAQNETVAHARSGSASEAATYESELEREYLAIGVEAGIKMPEVTLALDPFLQPDVERLTENGTKIVGIERAQVARNEFDYRTVKDLDRRSQKEQTTQGFRSQYLASALWLIYNRSWHQSDEAQDQLPDLRLLQTRLAASLGDDAAAQGRNEVAREYYAFVLERNPAEALALAKVRDYLRTMTGERFSAGTEKWRWEELRKLLDGEGPGGPDGARITCWTIVHIAGLSTAAYNAVLKALDNDAIRRALVGAMNRHIPGVHDTGSDFNTALATGVSLVSSHQERIVEQFKRFEASGFDLHNLTRAEGTDPLIGFDTDLPHTPLDFGEKGHVSILRASALPNVTNYLAPVSPSNKELLYDTADSSIDSARKELLAHPTRFGRRVLLPLLDRLRAALGAHFQEWKPTVAPAVDVTIEDTRERNEHFEIDLLITNAVQRRAAQDVQLELVISDWSLRCVFRESGGLDGGARKSQRWQLQKRKDQQTPASLTSVATVTFRLDGYEHRSEIELEIPLRPIPYQPWKSPYHPGPPVASDFMLKGREQEVTMLTEGVSDGERCTFFRIVGPRRIGKSSIMEAVRRRLLNRRDQRLFVTERFDIKMAGTHNVSLQRLLASWAVSIQASARSAGLDIPAFRRDPELLVTHQFLRWLEESVRPVGHLVFLVDEFQNVATMFDEHTLADFLAFWKTLIERRLLSGILCGVDSMDELIAGRGFGNQFASLQTVQVGYLDDIAARNLIEDPVRLPIDLSAEFEAYRGKSRYTPGAVNRLLDLTAGNPFFIQYICDSIVKLLNSVESRGMLVTEIAVKLAAQDFLRHDDFSTRFESLTDFNPGAPFSGGDAREIEGRLLATIALDTRDRSQCDLHGRIRSWPRRYQETAFLTLSRLERNKIVASDRGAHHYIRVGLYRLWFQQFRPFGDQPAPEA
ncbi:AAA family ATPase [Nannocystis punicea]|uniref:ORC1/DEAH AAA+ ATPase domain-containing protein n=1 Tax=Nannocystis punicea TaxID=2995304 RepID=A0ABY7GVN2_9BACT|nr:AAA family ATPase [Nannocystis poenicansa]WAS91017.1 hypothetical protein O0S08_32920 [Nannocystis poenicansa]